MREPVAIVGMAAVFPGAPDLATYWKNLEAGVDAIREVPASRWDPVYFDPGARAIDRFYCRRGGFVEPTFDPLAFGIMPVTVRGAEPDQLLALAVAAAALDDAGVAVPRDTTAVILGRGGYLTSGMARLANGVRTAQQLVTTLAELVPSLDADTLERVRVAFQQRASEELGPEQAIGLVPNLAASRIANRLDLRGPAYTIDAACASSLLAVDQGCRELEARRCDLVLAGGVHVCHDVTFWSVFTQLGALSRAQQIRPFDRKADGILIGEGSGIVVLERLADAERAGHRIYAVIRGTGVSSDGREASPMRPRLDGQLAALDAAWRGLDRAEVGLIEAHGTATPAGDGTELRALAQFFGPAADGARAAVGSVKSMIGHAMPAAGAAGLIKAALALHHGVIPPSLHCEEPHPELANTRFRVPAAAEPWHGPRRAGVSAFGFGGINAHVVLDAHGASRTGLRPQASGLRPQASDVSLPAMLAVAGDSIEELRAAVERGEGRRDGAMRLAMLEPSEERRAIALKVLERGAAWRGNRDIWFAPRPLGGQVAFVFPGIEAAFAPVVDDVAGAMGVALPGAIAEAAGAGAETVRDLERRGLGVFALGRLLADALGRLGVAPAALAGHSVGEWTGMVASEMIPPDAAAAFVAGLSPGSLEVPDVVFVAAGCGAVGARAALDGLAGIAVSHDNCPHQSILCGRREVAQVAVARLAERGVLCQELPFRSGFHSPLFADFLAPHRAHLATLALQPPLIPLWSATTCAPYPSDPAAIRALAIDHLVAPVRFRELIEAMYAANIRTFIQLGVGNLAGFIDDTLRGTDHLAISAAGQGARTGLAQLARVAAALWVEHHAVELGFAALDGASGLGPRASGDQTALRSPPRTDLRRPGLPLPLGAPLVRLDGAIPPLPLDPFLLARGPRPEARGPSSDPILAEALATLRDAADASHAILDAWRTAQHRSAEAPITTTIRRALSVDVEPALLDHCFYRQPDAWPTVSDRYPVVPMTMTITLMIDAARRTAPGKVAVALEDVRAYRWLAVAPPVDAELHVTRTGEVAEVVIPGYARATVRLADDYPPAPAPQLAPLTAPRPTPITAERLYVDRWMFHGPRYQGVVGLGPMGDDGVDGVIETLPAPGALLDCAGQLMGWWVMQTEARDRLAMPVHVERIALFGPEPPAGTRVACRVRMRKVEEREVRADLELEASGGRLWAKIDAWEDRRFDSDDAVWAVLMYPEHNALAVQREGWVLVTEHWRAAASRELMMRRYLGERERAAFAALPPRRQRGWLLGRIAIKDAVRRHLWDAGGGAMFPVEVEVTSAASGQPLVNVANLHVSVAHAGDRAVAIVGEGRHVGIDVERIAPRADGFADVAFSPEELALGAGFDGLEWQTRLWTAKEAVGKLRGTGVTDPKKLVVRAAEGGRLVIDDVAVDTCRDGEHVVAWTTGEAP